MKRRYLILGVLFVLSSTLTSCFSDFEEQETFLVEGLRPIYSSNEEWKKVTVIEPQPIKTLGKIYYKSGYIFVSEEGKGIHIINNLDPKTPTPVSFIQVQGNKDIAIKDNYLYADNAKDMLVLDIANLDSIQMVNRIPNLYDSNFNATFPSGYTGFFECVDETKGLVVGWETAQLTNPHCRR